MKTNSEIIDNDRLCLAIESRELSTSLFWKKDLRRKSTIHKAKEDNLKLLQNSLNICDSSAIM